MISALAQVLSPPSVSPSAVCLTEPGNWGALRSILAVYGPTVGKLFLCSDSSIWSGDSSGLKLPQNQPDSALLSFRPPWGSSPLDARFTVMEQDVGSLQPTKQLLPETVLVGARERTRPPPLSPPLHPAPHPHPSHPARAEGLPKQPQITKRIDWQAALPCLSLLERVIPLSSSEV